QDYCKVPMGGSIKDFRNWPQHYDVFVETGTFRGYTTEIAASHFKSVYTIELFRQTFEAKRARLKHYLNINLIFRDYAHALELHCPRIKVPAVFFLDAHFAGNNTARGDKEVPLHEELSHIAKRNLPDLVIIDDTDNFGRQASYAGDADYS